MDRSMEKMLFALFACYALVWPSPYDSLFLAVPLGFTAGQLFWQ